VIAGLLELLPIIGPIIAAVPAILIGATVGVEAAGAAFLLYLAIQQIENNVLVPKIQGDATELHPSAVILALVVGGAVAGLLGAILALPVAAAARDVYRYLFARLSVPGEPRSPTPGSEPSRGDPEASAEPTSLPEGPPAAPPASSAQLPSPAPGTDGGPRAAAPIASD
jgi:hypothetical protein